MKILFAALTLGLTGLSLSAAEGEKTYQGEMSCAKCNLGTADTCEDVLKVGEVVYLVEEKGNRKTSEHVCDGTSQAKITGKVEDRDGKKYLVASKIEVE